AGHDRLLPGDGAQFNHGGVHELGILRGLAHAHVDHDLVELGHGHAVGDAELGHERGGDFLEITFVQASVRSGCHAVSCGLLPDYFLSKTRPHFLQARWVRAWAPEVEGMRLSFTGPHSGHTTMTLATAIGASCSAMPPLIWRLGLGRVWRLIIITRSTRTRPSLG